MNTKISKRDSLRVVQALREQNNELLKQCFIFAVELYKADSNNKLFESMNKDWLKTIELKVKEDLLYE